MENSIHMKNVIVKQENIKMLLNSVFNVPTGINLVNQKMKEFNAQKTERIPPNMIVNAMMDFMKTSKIKPVKSVYILVRIVSLRQNA